MSGIQSRFEAADRAHASRAPYRTPRSLAGTREAVTALRVAGRSVGLLGKRRKVAVLFRPGQHLLAAKNYREIMRRRFIQWREIVGLQPAI
jgi:hypothetical protein